MKKMLSKMFLIPLVASTCFSAATTKKVALVSLYTDEWTGEPFTYMLFKLEEMPNNVKWFKISKTDNYANELLSMLLTAKTTGTEIEVTYDDATIETYEMVKRLVLK